MTIATYGYGGAGAICTGGFGDEEEGPVPPPPPPKPKVWPVAPRGGGGGHIEEPVMTHPSFEFVPVTGYLQEGTPLRKKKEILDMTPIMLQELLKQGRELQKSIRDRLFELTTRTKDLERLQANIKEERAKMFEENAMLKTELDQKYTELQKLYDSIINERKNLEGMQKFMQEGVKVSYTTPKFNIDLPALGGAFGETATLPPRFNIHKEKWLVIGLCAVVGAIIAMILYVYYQDTKKRNPKNINTIPSLGKH